MRMKISKHAFAQLEAQGAIIGPTSKSAIEACVTKRKPVIGENKELVVTVPIKLPSLLNTRMHWRAMDKLKRGQKTAVAICLLNKPLPALPVVITLTRFGPNKLDDDNLESSGKYARDQIAREYGVDDGSDQYEWRYEQRKSKEYSVEIRIETKQ